jgi:hypothetical protein
MSDPTRRGAGTATRPPTGLLVASTLAWLWGVLVFLTRLSPTARS